MGRVVGVRGGRCGVLLKGAGGGFHSGAGNICENLLNCEMLEML